jgi:FkbM family methyltransferase
MASGIAFKLKMFGKVRQTLRNWPVFILSYFGFIKNEFITLETKNGLRIKLRTNSTDLMAFTHVWLIQEYAHQGFEIKENDIVIDIGAHIGLYTLYASRICSKGKIYCFEPVKSNFDILLDNVNLNSIQNVTTYNLAVSGSTEKVKIYLNPDDSGHSMFISSNEFVEVDSISLKEIIDKNNIEKCNFLKLDCEGAEYDIINSLPDGYFAKIDKMIIEYHLANTKPFLLENLIKRLQSMSFKVHTKKLFDDIGFLYAIKH